MNWKAVAAAAILALASTPRVEADEPQPGDTTTQVAITPYVRIGEVTFHRSHEDAFPQARREGKLVILYRMLGELDGLT